MLDQKYEIHFAPLQGLTDVSFRRLHAQLFGGVDFYYTRMDTVTDKDTTVIGKFYFRQYEDYIFIFQLSNTDGVETEEFKQVLTSFTDSIKA